MFDSFWVLVIPPGVLGFRLPTTSLFQEHKLYIIDMTNLKKKIKNNIINTIEFKK